DLNPAQNPFRGDSKLITNMPAWFVKTWEDAGFCWGGRWIGSKDPMHFSWRGPRATATSDDALEPLAPRTIKTTFGSREKVETEFSGVTSRYLLDLADGSSNGTNDVIGLRAHPDGSVVDVASSTGGFGGCSIFRWFVPDSGIATADHIVFADVDGDSGQDLVALTPAGDTLDASVATRGEGFEHVDTYTTGMAADTVALAAADFDGDHISDLWALTPDGTIAIWAGPGFSNKLSESDVPGGAPTSIAAGDRDGGDTPELFALFASGAGSRIDVLDLQGAAWTPETSFPVSGPPATIEDLGAGDYDGDGRADVQVLRADGSIEIFIGNTTTGVPPSRWFLDPGRGCDDPVVLDFAGIFMDDENSTFVVNIESIASTGVTRGCNPPFNDKFCPAAEVTRGQMAAFLVRALGLSADNGRVFTDVPAGSTFAADIARLAAADITKGCNPPANDRFCPNDRVTREQMAAFLVRSLSLVADTHGGFDDVPANSTFAGDIARLASAGITRGCDPPDNDRFCPRDAVTRGQMAAFLDRAGLGG
ncbi:MAG: S-layer homology domain-containing protein, partial [Acidimicrobiia bacterium]